MGTSTTMVHLHVVRHDLHVEVGEIEHRNSFLAAEGVLDIAARAAALCGGIA
jgi:hypothetical protein